MDNYIIREGVMLTSILDQYILVSVKACRDKCPYVKMVNETAAYFWKMIEKGCSIEEMTENACNQYGVTDMDEMRNDIHEYILSLQNAGYLLSEDEVSAMELQTQI